MSHFHYFQIAFCPRHCCTIHHTYLYSGESYLATILYYRKLPDSENFEFVVGP